MRSLFSGNKKGQVGNLTPAILALVFAAVVLVFGIVISQSLRDTDTLKSSVTTTNETGAWLNGSGYKLHSEQGSKTNGFSIVAIWGNTPNEDPTYNYSIALANATVNTDTGIVSNTTDPANATIYNNLSFTYGYRSGSDAWNSANKTVFGLGTFADFWEIIVLAIVITVVIGLLLAVFGGRSKSR